MGNKKAIAVVSFGTTYTDSAEKSIKAVEREVANTFKDYVVTSAYTSKIVRDTLDSRGVHVPSPEECFEDLVAQGVRELTVLPTNIIAGEEYNKLVECVTSYFRKFYFINMCRPMVEKCDLPKIVDTLIDTFPMEEDEFVILMGHGSKLETNALYNDIDYELDLKCKKIFIANVESDPNLNHALRFVSWWPIRKIILAPFMLTAGEHVHKDMCGLWKKAFESMGYQVECVIKGLGEYPQFRQIYIDRLKEVLC